MGDIAKTTASRLNKWANSNDKPRNIQTIMII